MSIELIGEVELKAASGEKPATVSILAYAGGAVIPEGTHVPHIIDLAGLTLPDSVPLLLDHDNRIDSIAGSGVPTIRGGEVFIDGTLARSTSSAQKVIGLAKAGVKLGASVGVEGDKVERIHSGKRAEVNGTVFSAEGDGLIVFRRGVLREVSIVPVGADREAGVVSIAASRGKAMSVTATEQAKILARVEGVELKCSGAFQGRLAEVKERALSGELDALAFEREVESIIANDHDLHQLRASRIQAGTLSTHAPSRDGVNERVLCASLCLAGGLSHVEDQFDERTLDAADSMRRHVGLQRILMQAACENGYQAGHAETIHAGNLRSILTHSFQPQLRASGFSTIDVGGLLGNTANKFLLDGWQETSGDEWKKISDIKLVKDFKTNTSYRLLESAEYEQVPPTGEIKHGTMGEQSMTVKADTYGKMFAITRTDIINDDLGALSDVPRRLGRAAGMKFRRIYWAAFLAADNFFSAGNGNVLTGAGTALSETSLISAVGTFRKMRTSTADGKKLIGGAPAVLMVPSELEFTARKLLQSSTVVAGGSTSVGIVPGGNPLQGLAELVVVDWLSDSDLTGFSAAKWYLLRSPVLAPAMIVAFLNGQQSPTVEQADADFNTLGIQIRGYHDFGVGRAEPLCGLQVAGTA